jgi:putative addiction module component (TIGR02574 family)
MRRPRIRAVAVALYFEAMATSTKVLDEAMKLPVRERIRLAEKLLESADAEGGDDEAAIQSAWAVEVQQRSNELRDKSVRGLSLEEARRIVATDPTDDER